VVSKRRGTRWRVTWRWCGMADRVVVFAWFFLFFAVSCTYLFNDLHEQEHRQAFSYCGRVSRIAYSWWGMAEETVPLGNASLEEVVCSNALNGGIERDYVFIVVVWLLAGVLAALVTNLVVPSVVYWRDYV